MEQRRKMEGLAMSRPVHFNRKSNWAACGKQSDLQAYDYRHVTCLLCRKTNFWKTCESLDRVAKISNLGEYQKQTNNSMTTTNTP